MACKIQFNSEDCKSQNLLVNMNRGKKLSHGVAALPRSKRLYSKAKLSLWPVSPEQVCYKQLNQQTDKSGSCLGSRNGMLPDGRKLPLPLVTFKSIIQPQGEQEGNNIYFSGLADFPSQILNCSCKSQSP